MKALAIDIGAGTRDILLYDPAGQLENCIKLVLPSPSPLFSARVAEETARGNDIYFEGCVIGGGSFSRAVKRHVAEGHKVYMSGATAYCLRNNLDDVRAAGVELVEEEPEGFSGTVIRLDELDLSPLEALLNSVGRSLEELAAAAVAVQDHGTYPAGESNRKTRLAFMRERLQEDPRPSRLAFSEGEVPGQFPRMASAMARMREQLDCGRLMVMDTAPAAIAGCLADELVEGALGGNLLVINAGNGHTMCCILSNGSIVGLLEHHTRYLDPPAAFEAYLELFCDGKASDSDGFMERGHGLFYLEDPPGFDRIDLVAVTGPKRSLLRESGLDVYYPSPGGDMMMTGPMGLVRVLGETA
jgi:uncharacterized protein (DUF1786 family)